MIPIEFIGGPLDGLHVPRSNGIPKPMPWAVYYACGCVEYVDDVLTPSDSRVHRRLGAEAYYPLDEERTTPQLIVYSLPPISGGIDALPQRLEVPEPLVTASVDANDHPGVVVGWHIGGSVASVPQGDVITLWGAV